MAALKARLYNVLFGDAILVQVPDRDAAGRETIRHILIDVGNAPSKEGADNAVHPIVVEDVLEVLDGRPLDLYVMTHEHLDHVEGLRYADQHGVNAGKVKARLDVQYAWFTASADPTYYDAGRHDDAKKQLDALRATYAEIARRMTALPAATQADLGGILANNDARGTRAYVDWLLDLAPTSRTSWVYRGMPAKALKHPFREAKFRIWAPEEDTSEYYGRLAPMAAAPGSATGAATTGGPEPLPPRGVDAGAFHRLVQARQSGLVENLLAIDKAANNTSVVFSLAWRGWKLVFAGDAEVKSWKIMQREKAIEPVHFLKVSHHGSHNGTPGDELLDALLPMTPTDGRPRRAYISSHKNTYPGIPHAETDDRLRRRGVEVRSTNELPTLSASASVPKDQRYLEIAFPG